jgi:hypothetical protein
VDFANVVWVNERQDQYILQEELQALFYKYNRLVEIALLPSLPPSLFEEAISGLPGPRLKFQSLANLEHFFPPSLPLSFHLLLISSLYPSQKQIGRIHSRRA